MAETAAQLPVGAPVAHPRPGESVEAVSSPHVERDVASASTAAPMILFAYARLRHEFASLLAQRPCGGEPLDPEAIHQVRIATRRLRTGLRLFRHMLPGGAAKDFDQQFRWLARGLAEVRDLDVYAANIDGYLRMLAPEQRPQLDVYVRHLAGLRAEARSRLGAVLCGQRFVKLLADFAAFLDEPPSAGALRRWRSFRVCDGVSGYLERSFKRVRRIGARAQTDGTPARLHRLRVKAKRLRYEMEFFVDIYPALKGTIKGTRRLQGILGQHQDACTATERLREYARTLDAGPDDAISAALARLLMVQEQEALRARDRFPTEWRRYERAVGSLKLDKSAVA